MIREEHFTQLIHMDFPDAKSVVDTTTHDKFMTFKSNVAESFIKTLFSPHLCDRVGNWGIQEKN